MKKIILSILAMCVLTPFCHALNASIALDIENEKKDPKLIKITTTKDVSDKSYTQKITQDDKKRQSYKKHMSEDEFYVYEILDKIIRANSLQYQNWRMGIKTDSKNDDDINLVYIKSSLYDSLSQNDDAIAFLLSQKLAYMALGYQQIVAQNESKITKLEAQVKELRAKAEKEEQMRQFNEALHNNDDAFGNNISSAGYRMNATSLENKVRALQREAKMLELQADSEAVTLLTRAGYNYRGAQGALKLIAQESYTTRAANIEEEVSILEIPELQKQGKSNIYSSDVLEVKKSTDKKTYVISRGKNIKKLSYTPESRETKLLKAGYNNYIKNDFPKSINCFEKAFILNPANYVPALYLSYMYEINYNSTNDKKSLKKSRYWIKKANKLSPNDKNVQKQFKDINKLSKKQKDKD